MNTKRIGRRPMLIGAVASVGPWALLESEAAAIATRTAVERVGRLEIIAMLDAAGPFFTPTNDAFSGATEAQWAAAEQLDPRAFGPDGQWLLDFRCFAIRRPGGRTMLVDSGVGPEGSPASTWAPVPGRLPQVLAAEDIAVDDVDIVVLTHLHSDHVGWAVLPDGTPMFPHARYVVQQRELDLLDRTGSVWSYVVEPLRRADQLHAVSGRSRLLGGGTSVHVTPTPGHTPGHQSVFIDSGCAEVVITGDVLVHAVQLVNPAVGYAYEGDQIEAARTRTALVEHARARHALLATPHLRTPFVSTPPQTTNK